MSEVGSTALVEFVRSLYTTDKDVHLHTPTLGAPEKAYVCKAIDSNFVSTAGAFVREFEQALARFTGSQHAVSTTNGTAALHSSLFHLGTGHGDLVITQAVTFVATCNAIHQLGAQPVFVDISRDTLGMCEHSLEQFLDSECVVDDDGHCVHRPSGKLIKAVVPMHTFGHPVKIDAIIDVASRFHLPVVEDAAESLGSSYKGQHTGTFGRYGVFSFNGNKIITTGGGGMITCADEQDACELMHLTTTAKVSHAYEFFHDRVGFNYRMPNLNAALGMAQMSRLAQFLESKRAVANAYASFFSNTDFEFVTEPEQASSNYWLNAVHCPDKASRDKLLKTTNACGIMTRPVWTLMNRLPSFASAIRTDLPNSIWAESTLVNLPSSPISVS